MSAYPIYVVNAFSHVPFGGNPAAVMPLAQPWSSERRQQIAAQNQLSETAYFWPSQRPDADFDLSWFTPETEVSLCGHATLASAWVLFECLNWSAPQIRFHTASGGLRVWREGETIWLDLPMLPVQQHPEGMAAIKAALNTPILEVWRGTSKWLAVVADLSLIRPDNRTIAALPTEGLIVSAASRASDIDFVSRYFAPQVGITEDPVTGSAHCALTPFWAQRLGRNPLRARQCSARGGDLQCQWMGERVHLGGQAHLYLRGEVLL